uniref:Synaptotagmin like 2 n=1 Tax=Chelonoidis abingdonii TaxID=106734 RepID=A0A8C0HEH1_CHEAB
PPTAVLEIRAAPTRTSRILKASFKSVNKMIDLSFLTEEEQEAIMKVLQRDAELKRKEDERVRHLPEKIKNDNQLKNMSGQWFYEAKSKRHRDKIHGADIIRASIRRKPTTTGKFISGILYREFDLLESDYVKRAENDSNRLDALQNEQTLPVKSPRSQSSALDVNTRDRDVTQEDTSAPYSSDANRSSLPVNETLQLKTSLPMEPVTPRKSSSNISPNVQEVQTVDETLMFFPFSCVQVSGSVMSIYSGDFGNVDVKGHIQFAIDYVEQLKELHIFVSQCKDLAIADVKKQHSDPYVKTYLLPEKYKLGKRKTSVKKKTLNPVYNEILRVLIYYLLMNIGFLFVSSKGNKTPSTGEVHIWVKECNDLPLLRGNKINSFVKCTILPDTSRKSRQKTRAVAKTTNPVFNHTMVYDGFRADDLKEACVELTVWDHNKLANHFLGGLRIGMGTGKSYGIAVDWMDSTLEETTLWERMMSSPNTWVEDTLPLRMLMVAKLAK